MQTDNDPATPDTLFFLELVCFCQDLCNFTFARLEKDIARILFFFKKRGVQEVSRILKVLFSKNA